MADKSFKLGMIAPLPPPYGGIAHWTRMVCDYGDRQKDLVIQVIDTSPKIRAIEGRNIWDRIFGSGWQMLRQRALFQRMIAESKPDAVHITTSGTLGIIRDILLLRLARQNSIPTFYHLRFGRIAEIAEAQTMEWKMIAKAMAIADVVIAIDEFTASAIRKHLPDVNVIKIPNPIDMTKLPQALDPVQNSRTVVFLGWVVRTKGIEELISAWNQLRPAAGDWTLKIVGPYSADYVEDLKGRYDTEGIVFTGEKTHQEAMEILGRADIFVLPSYTEGFPNVVVEAMSLARPIIATDVGAIPEMLADNCGKVIPVKNTDELRAAIQELIENPEHRNQMGRAAFKKAADSYTLEKVFAKYLDTWKSYNK